MTIHYLTGDATEPVKKPALIMHVCNDALATCLRDMREWISVNRRLTIHCPRIGCGLAGGSWSVVEPLIEFYLKDREVYVYDLPGDAR